MTKKTNLTKVRTETVKITVVYDNNPMIENLLTDWGFSCLIEVENTRILFDTGNTGDILMSNMEKLGIDPQSIDIVFLSHFHHDHTGGLDEFLKINSDVKIYYPKSFPLQIVYKIKYFVAESFPVSSSVEISHNIFSLGEMEGEIPEQSLVIRSTKGLIVISGCAHPGIINILEKAKSVFQGENIYLALGGFHLYRSNEQKIENIIRNFSDMGIISVAPLHCTGNMARRLFQKVFNINYIEMGVGKIIKIN